MKVVSCKNCGAKYQLDDDDDISTYECSSCAGDLEVIENYPSSPSTSNSTLFSPPIDENTYVTQCQDCGLKYRIGSNENILDYECESCGGSLRYVDNNLNKEVDAYVKDHGHQQIKKSKPEEEQSKRKMSALKSIPGKIEELFSEDQLYKITEEDLEEEKKDVKTARTQIPKSLLFKFEKESSVPKSNDYNQLLEYLKSNFYKGVMIYYEEDEKPIETKPKSRFKSIVENLSIKEPTLNEKKDYFYKKDKLKFYDNIAIYSGIILFVISTIDIFTINRGYGLVLLLIGVAVLCIGLYKSKDVQDNEKRSKVIRDRLLTLSSDYYVLYGVKIPKSNEKINHLVIGPSGVYSIISQKYNPKIKLDSENENKNLIGSISENDKLDEILNSEKEFKYTTKQVKFSQDNKVKQKSLTLGENLINFFNKHKISCFVEPIVGFVNNEVVIINLPLTDEDLFIEELLYRIENGPVKLDSFTIDKCAVLLNKYATDCSIEIEN